MPAIGQGDEVVETMQQALAIWREVGERRGEASMLMNIGNRLVDTGCYEEGLDHLEQAIEGHREIGSLLDEALALTNLGRAQDILGEIDDALASWKRALQLFVDLDNPSGELASRMMLGSALGSYGEHEEARAHLEAVVKLAQRTGNKTRLVEGHGALGQLLHTMGERATAWEHLDQALKLDEELKSARSRVLTLIKAGSAALEEGDHERAIRLLAEALPDAHGGGDAQPALILCRISRAHRGAGNPDEARACAADALARLEAAEDAAPVGGPEVYYTLSQNLDDDERRAEFRARAREMIENRARQIRNGSYREYYLTRIWPNAEIFAAEQGPPAEAESP
jgi:tetratricopeptide (TPR) repeat protein